MTIKKTIAAGQGNVRIDMPPSAVVTGVRTTKTNDAVASKRDEIRQLTKDMTDRSAKPSGFLGISTSV